MTNNNDMELLEMKQQLQDLKTKLVEQTTLHEGALKKQLSKGAHSFRNRELSSAVLVGAVAVLMPIVLHQQGMTNLFCAATGVFFLFALGWEIYYFRKFHLSNLMEGDLVTTAKHLQEYKRLNRIWLYRVGFPFIIMWGAWYLWEMVQTLNLTDVSDEKRTGVIVGLAVGMLIGGTIGGLIGYFTFYRPQMKLADEMNEQIAELTEE